MPIQLEFNLDQKDPIDHLMYVWAKNETSNQKRFRRLFAENSAIKKRLNRIEEMLGKEDNKNCEFYEFDLFTYKKEA